jgi:hypothetical protein
VMLSQKSREKVRRAVIQQTVGACVDGVQVSAGDSRPKGRQYRQTSGACPACLHRGACPFVFYGMCRYVACLAQQNNKYMAGAVVQDVMAAGWLGDRWVYSTA